MKLLIEIPDTDIPKRQDILSVDLCFVDGQVGQCTYPFEVLQEEEKTAHWIDHHNGTISCSHCDTWFYKDDRYYYMRHCPYCGENMIESEYNG